MYSIYIIYIYIYIYPYHSTNNSKYTRVDATGKSRRKKRKETSEKYGSFGVYTRSFYIVTRAAGYFVNAVVNSSALVEGAVQTNKDRPCLLWSQKTGKRYIPWERYGGGGRFRQLDRGPCFFAAVKKKKSSTYLVQYCRSLYSTDMLPPTMPAL